MSAIIDPIDGTAMFSMHLPEWCVSVGIFRGYTPVYGFVYSPGFDMLFYNDDSNAYLNGRPLKADRNISVDNETNIFSASEVSNRFIVDFPGKIRNLGSTALHACLAADNARNRTLAFIGKSNIWDWAGAVPGLKTVEMAELAPLARHATYLRAHWQRRPPRLLVPHLFHKAFISRYQHAPKPA